MGLYHIARSYRRVRGRLKLGWMNGVKVTFSKRGIPVEAASMRQPVAEVLAYLHVQISPISCNVVGSILHVFEKTQIVGYRWTGVVGHHALCC